jgi:putative (di)nucleoside polyphosphate hydrolase
MSQYAHLPYRQGVGVMLLNQQNQVFVARRIDMVAEAWQMPQGGIDDGENPERAVYRELEEETSISADKVTLLARGKTPFAYDLPDDLAPLFWQGKYRGQSQYWYVMRFLPDNDAVINLATEHPEFSEYKWVKPADLPDLIVSFKRDLYQDLLTEFSEFL